jgi:hypothetical protein
MYEEYRNDVNAVRYNYMVDGEIMSGTMLRSIKLGKFGMVQPGTSLGDIPGRILLQEFKRRMLAGNVRSSISPTMSPRRFAANLPIWLYWKPAGAVLGEERARSLYFAVRRAVGQPSASDPAARQDPPKS